MNRVATIQIRNVPDDVHLVYRRRAVMAGMSLQEYLLKFLTDEARVPTLGELFGEIDHYTGGHFTAEDAVAALHEERRDR